MTHWCKQHLRFLWLSVGLLTDNQRRRAIESSIGGWGKMRKDERWCMWKAGAEERPLYFTFVFRCLKLHWGQIRLACAPGDARACAPTGEQVIDARVGVNGEFRLLDNPRCVLFIALDQKVYPLRQRGLMRGGRRIVTACWTEQVWTLGLILHFWKLCSCV